MKFIVLSDIHVEDYPSFNTSAFSRLEESVLPIKDAFKLAADLNGHILFAGDLFDKAGAIKAHVLNIVFSVFKDMFERYPNVKFIAISGNHDMTTRSFVYLPAESALKVLQEAFENFILLDDRTEKWSEGNVTVHGVPFFDKRELWLEYLSHQQVSEGGIDILLTHQTDNTQPNTDIFYDDVHQFDMVFNGHIHNFNKIGHKMYTVGNPHHRDLSDEGKEKYILEFDTQTMKVTPIKTSYKQLVKPTVQLRPTNTMSNKVEVVKLNDSVQQQFYNYCQATELNQELVDEGKKYIQ